MLHLATWLQTSDPTIVEVLAPEGFDYFIVDMEHSSLSTEQLANLMRAVPRDSKTQVLVRVKDNETLCIRQALDMGAAGVIVPMIHTAADARRAVAAAKYPPMGIRGTSYCRMNLWGHKFDEYQAAAGSLLTIAMIETPEGVDNVAEIAGTPGIDGIMIGSYDLSTFCGIPGQVTHPKIQAAEQKIVSVCQKLNKLAGILVFVPSPEKLKRVKDAGFNLISVGSELMFMQAAARQYVALARS